MQADLARLGKACYEPQRFVSLQERQSRLASSPNGPNDSHSRSSCRSSGICRSIFSVDDKSPMRSSSPISTEMSVCGEPTLGYPLVGDCGSSRYSGNAITATNSSTAQVHDTAYVLGHVFDCEAVTLVQPLSQHLFPRQPRKPFAIA
jgi:hypothetical protein